MEREQRKNLEPRPAAQEMMESQYETGYTTGDTGNELDRDHTDYLYRWATTPVNMQSVFVFKQGEVYLYSTLPTQGQFKVVFISLKQKTGNTT